MNRKVNRNYNKILIFLSFSFFIFFLFSSIILSLSFNSKIVYSESSSCNNNILDYFYFEKTGSDSSFTVSSQNEDFLSFDVSYAFKLVPKEYKVKEVKSIVFSSDGFVNDDFNIDFLSSEKNDDEYIVHLTLSPKSFSLNNLNSNFNGNIGFSAIITFIDIEGNEKTLLFCLPMFDVNIIVDEDVVPDDLKEGISKAKKYYDTFKKLDSAVDILQVTYSLLCEDKQKNYTGSVEKFNEKCSVVKNILIEDLKNSNVDLDSFCNENKDSFKGTSDDEKIQDCKNTFGYCKSEYYTILQYEKNMLDVCMRVSCNPVFTKEEHSKKYSDFLGINYCDNIDSDKCESQFERIENTKCEFLDVKDLDNNKNTFTFKNPFEQYICGSPKEEVTTLIDPSSSIISSAACLCIPSLSGYVKTYKDMYENYVSCLEGKGEKDASECLNVNYVFLCETVLDSFSCGFLDLASYGKNVESFLDENDKAYVINVNFESTLKNKVRQKYSVFTEDYLKSSFNVNTASLNNAICRTAFGDENVDWGKVLLNAVSFNIDYSLTSGVNVCSINKELTNSCYCGRNTNIVINTNGGEVNIDLKNNCGENYICTKEDEDFKCKEKSEVSIPNNKENSRIEETIVTSKPIISYHEFNDAAIFYSNNDDVASRVLFCTPTKDNDGIEVLNRVLIREDNVLISSYTVLNNKKETRENLFPSKYVFDYCDRIEYSCNGKSFIFKGYNCEYVKKIGDSFSSFRKGSIIEEVPIEFEIVDKRLSDSSINSADNNGGGSNNINSGESVLTS